MEYKINDKVYGLRYKLDEITFDDYLTVIDILSEDQYDTYIDKHSGKEVNRKEPYPKNERTEEFIMNLYRRVVKKLSNIPLKYTKEDEVVSHCIELLNDAFSELNMNNSVIDATNENKCRIFTYNDEDLSFIDTKEWSFYKWVTIEHYLSKGIQEKDGEDIINVIKGNRFILPLLFGDWKDDLDGLNDRLDFFNNSLAVDVIPSYVFLMTLIGNIRKAHTFIYSGSSGGGKPNMSKHNSDFGWLDTLRGLAEKRVFGSYIELKNTSFLEVLEYLNTSISHDKAEAADFKIK